MEPDQTRSDELQAASVARPWFSPAWIYAGLAVFMAAFIWLTVSRLSFQITLRPVLSLVFFLLQVLMVAALERAFKDNVGSLDWRYRLAFLTSLVYGWATCLVSTLLYSRSPGIAIYLLGWLGSFAGGLFATSLNGRLWENNSPPSQRVQDEVYRLHNPISSVLLPPSPVKRIFDISLALLGILLAAPIWLLCVFFLWLEDPGPVLFVKNSVGMGGRNFRQYKFRTMVREAEVDTGPVLSAEGDQRVLLFGKLLRKSALDELPQLINILTGEMSFVGPRPQRTILVHEYLVDLPEYAHRHRVLPGLSGLAQIAGDYYLTPHQKLRLDQLYIRHASFGFDLKLLGLAFVITFGYRWKKGWNGRLPRRLIRLGSKAIH